MAHVQLRVVLVDQQQELTVEVPGGATISDVGARVLEARQLNRQAYGVRLIQAGRELRPHERAADCAGAVLHAAVVERAGPPSAGEAGPAPPPVVQPPVQPPPDDWLDRVDPSTLLVALCGGALVVLWLLVLTSKYLFDLASIAILTSMTLAYVLPVLLGAFPLPGVVRGLLGLPPLPPHAGAGDPSHPQHHHHHPHHERLASQVGSYVPPRPEAQMRPGQALPEQQQQQQQPHQRRPGAPHAS